MLDKLLIEKSTQLKIIKTLNKNERINQSRRAGNAGFMGFR